MSRYLNDKFLSRYENLAFMTQKEAEQVLSNDPLVGKFSFTYGVLDIVFNEHDIPNEFYTEEFKKYRNLKSLYEPEKIVLTFTITV